MRTTAEEFSKGANGSFLACKIQFFYVEYCFPVRFIYNTTKGGDE